MKKIIFSLFLTLFGFFQPPLQAAIDYDSRSPRTEESLDSQQSRIPKKQRKAKGIHKTKAAGASALTFTIVFSFIASIAFIVLGIVFSLNVLLVSGIVFASILFLLLIAIIVLIVAGTLS